MIGPKGIPESAQPALNKEFLAALDDGEVRDRLSGFGLQVPERADNTPARSSSTSTNLPRPTAS